MMLNLFFNGAEKSEDAEAQIERAAHVAYV